MTASISKWEAAYERFETPAQEIAKFRARLKKLGAEQWPRDAKIVEIFCGRGNGLHALAEIGFTNLEGVDLSANLVSRYQGPAKMYVADCRTMPFDDGSRDVLIVQGGLHHLPALLPDLERTLGEAGRVVKPGGLFVAVEPWLTPFLRFVHAVARNRAVRAMSAKMDAFQTMVENEQDTYARWLSHPSEIESLLNKHFTPRLSEKSFGKLIYVGVRP
jgi:ubiquinone/menaquinone biosynthesis C-methylase UbiE